MKKFLLSGASRTMLAVRYACAVGVALAAGSAAQAATEIQVWHSLSDTNKAEFDKVVKQYNSDQSDVVVKTRAFPSQQALQSETRAAISAKKAPNLVQFEDNHSPEVVAEHKAVLPLYELLAKYPIKDLNWFLPGTASFTKDAKGRLLAFPFMAEIPVMFYNTDLYKKAGLDVKAPARTWQDLQGELLKLRDVAQSDCPYATSDQVEVHIENLAPINNQTYTTNANGLTVSKVASNFQFDTLYMRHISLMVSWKRSLLFTKHTSGNEADKAFASGECAVLTSGSGAFGEFNAKRGLSFGVAPLPFYAQATKQGGRPFVSGSAFWAMDGRPQAEEKATAGFLAFLSKPVVAAAWHQRTGFLPLTDAAFRASDVSFYSKVPGAQAVVASMRDNPTANERGFRMANYDRIQPVIDRELDDAFEGKTPPMAALNNVQARAKNLPR